MKYFNAFVIVALSLAAAACGNKNSDDPSGGGGTIALRAEPVAGVIDGQAWEFKSGRAKKDAFDPNALSIELWSEDVADPCTSFNWPDRKISFYVPNQPADHVLSNTLNFTLYSYAGGQNRNVVVTQGVLRITEVSNLQVSGALIGSYNDANHANGSFAVPYCDN